MPSIRRVVTGHSADGKAVVVHDGPAPNVKYRQASGITSDAGVDDRREPPPIMRAKATRRIANGGRRRRRPAPSSASSTFRRPRTSRKSVSSEAVLKEMGLTEHPPADAAARSPFMHRTKSVDYAIVLDGEIDMLLDETEVHLGAGDVLVQRGTNHAWVNRGTQRCRIAFVLIDAKP